MAKHTIVLILDDDTGDIQAESDLEEFVWNLKQGTYYRLEARWLLNFPEAEED